MLPRRHCDKAQQKKDTEEEAVMHPSQMGVARTRSSCAVSPRAGQTQLAILQSEFGKTHGVQHQPAPVSPVHLSQRKAENEGGEEKTRRSRGIQQPVKMDRRYQEAALKGGLPGILGSSFVMPTCIQKTSGRAHGTKADTCSLKRWEKEFSPADSEDV